MICCSNYQFKCTADSKDKKIKEFKIQNKEIFYHRLMYTNSNN